MWRFIARRLDDVTLLLGLIIAVLAGGLTIKLVLWW